MVVDMVAFLFIQAITQGQTHTLDEPQSGFSASNLDASFSSGVAPGVAARFCRCLHWTGPLPAAVTGPACR
jgi:hypothetical protein